MTGIFDSHAHYDDARFDDCRDALLTSLFQSKTVSHLVNIGTNLQTSQNSIDLAERYPQIYAAVGIYPGDCLTCGEEDKVLETIAAMLCHEKVVAIGEIGLDYHYDETPREIQRHWMRRQMELARETGFPVILHDREAHGDCMDIIREFPEVTGVFHCYSGSAEMIPEIIRRGWYVSFSGVITFKNANRILDAVRAVPDDRILVETDCPYLAPHPMRGKTNRSDYLTYTLQAAAMARSVDVQQLCDQTAENAKRFYRIVSD